MVTNQMMHSVQLVINLLLSEVVQIFEFIFCWACIRDG
ncbi:hypothetical protein P20495_3604 [Pseudoalteromonas sp. BSi20495]|nr:hypothetical protein P20495_3604 [Pseudoalteromonas sp. BSi20495]